MSDYPPITNELELFLLFYELDRLGYLLHSRLDRGIIPGVSVKHVQALLKELGKKRSWAFTQLSQFNVEPFKMTGETITEEYRAWYKWWKDYFLGFPEDVRLKILENSNNECPNPSGSWKELIGKC